MEAAGKREVHSVYMRDRRSVSVSVFWPEGGWRIRRGHWGWRRQQQWPPQCCDWSGLEGDGTSQQSLAPPPPTRILPFYNNNTAAYSSTGPR